MKHTNDKLSRRARLMKTLQHISNSHWLTPHIKIGILTDLHYSVWLHNTAVSALCYQKNYRSLIMTSINSLLIRQIYKLHSWDLFPLLMQTLNFQHHWKQTKQEFGTEIVPREWRIHFACLPSQWRYSFTVAWLYEVTDAKCFPNIGVRLTNKDMNVQKY